MSNEVQVFDPNALKELIASKIKAQFVELIPEDAWNTMVSKEINSFVNSELPKLIKSELEKFALVEIQNFLKDESNKYKWAGNTQQCASEVIKQVVTENASTIFGSIFADMTQVAIRNTSNNMQRSYY